jgi:biotin transport system substrate-specific component
LGGKRGTISVIVYILLGLVGLPVFSGFKGGAGVLMGPTGGYILGFVISALIMWVFESLAGKKILVYIISMIFGLAACYAFGTLWFMVVYNAKNDSPATLSMVLGWCVIPFIIPDMIKIVLALIIGQNRQLKKILV